MKIIILAHENDSHTKPIKWALEQTGYRVLCWPQLGWQPGAQASIVLRDTTYVALGQQRIDPGDVVWVRRPNPPEPNPQVLDLDRKFAEGEYKASFNAIMYLLENLPIRCVNKFSAFRFISNKSVQLILAKECGMHIPATLISNSPDAIRSFVPERGTICKAFLPHVWQKGETNRVSVTRTFEIQAHELPADEVLTFAPAIFQERVSKQLDIRTVLMGSSIFSYSLASPKRSLDWRDDYDFGLEVSPIDTPPEVEHAILAFAKRSGIIFGSLDFVVDSNGKWWFLEVNEQGQFLWLDQYNPQCRMQQKFLAFLTLPDGAARADIDSRQSMFPSCADYVKSDFAKEAPLEPASTAHLSVEPITDRQNVGPALQL